MQPVQRFLHPLFPVPGVQCLDAVLQGVQIQTVGTTQIEIARGPGIGQAQAGRFEHRALQIQDGFLGHIGHPQPGLDLQGAVIRLLQAGKYLQQRRLAGAVAPDQPHAFLDLERKVGVIKQRNMAISQLRIQQSDECHGKVRVRSVTIIPAHEVMRRWVDGAPMQGILLGAPLHTYVCPAHEPKG